MTIRRFSIAELVAVSFNLGIGAGVLALPRIARADDAACFADAERGQQLRNDGKLIDARGRFIACARPGSCPDEVVRECRRWLGDVDEQMPSIVLGARDDRGADLVDVQVSVDGKLTASTADGRPLPIDPGPHVVRFDRSGSAPAEQTIVVRAGERNRSVIATLARAPSAPAPTLTVPPPATVAEHRRAFPTVSLVLAGVGVAALGAFTWFGLSGVADYDRYGCEAGCLARDKDKVDRAFVVADVALGVGVLALAGAAVVYFTQPDRPTRR